MWERVRDRSVTAMLIPLAIIALVNLVVCAVLLSPRAV